MTFIDCVKLKYADKQSSRVARDGCSLPTQNCAPILILDCDKFKHERKKADFIIFDGRPPEPWALIVELKSGDIGHANSILDQLQGSACIAEQVIDHCPTVYRFRPIILHGGRIHPNDYKILGRRKIKMGTQSKLALVKRCGTHLDDLVKQA